MKKKYEKLLSNIIEDILQQNPDGDSKITTLFNRDVVNQIKSTIPNGEFYFKCQELKETFVFDRDVLQDSKKIFNNEKYLPKEYYCKFFFFVFSYLYADQPELISEYFNEIVLLFITFNSCFNFKSISNFFAITLLHSINIKTERFNIQTISNIVKFASPYVEENNIIFESLIKILSECNDEQNLHEIGPAFYNINIDKFTSNNSLVDQFLNSTFEGAQKGNSVYQKILGQCFKVSSNPLLTTFIKHIASERSNTPIKDINFNKIEDEYSQKYEFNNQYPTNLTYSDDLTLNIEIPSYCIDIDYCKFMDTELLKSIQNDFEIYLSSSKKEYVDAYIEEFVRKENVIAVILLSSLCKSKVSEQAADLIIKAPIFGVTNSMFSNNTEFANQHFIRQEAIEILLLGKYFNKLHNEYQNYPYLTAEFLARSISLANEFELFLSPKDIAQKIAFFSTEFAKRNDKLMHFCRFLYSILFSHLCLTRQNYLDADSWYCLYSVLDIPIIRDPAVRTSITAFSEKKLPLIDSLCLLEKISDLILEQKSEKIASIFMDILIISSAAQFEFRSAAESLLKIAFKQSQCEFESIRKKAWRVIYLLIRQTKYCIPDHINAEICKLFDQVTFKNGTLFFSGTVTSLMKNRGSQFLIPTPQTIPIYFYIAGNTGEYSKMLQSIDQLAEYSYLNVEKLHEGNFDSIILKLIESFPEPITYKGCPIKNFESMQFINMHVLPILSKIFLQATSQETAKEVIDAIFPLQKGKNDTNISLSSTLLWKISSLYNHKTCRIPIMKQQKILEYSPVMLHSFIKGSTIVFWIHVDKGMSVNNKKLDFTIVKAFNGEDPFINIFISKGELTLQIRQVTKMSSFVLSDDIPKGEWTQIAISIKGIPEKNQMIITSIKNKTEPSTSQVVLEEMEDAELSIVWGNDKETDTTKDERMFYLSNFCLIGSALVSSETDKMFDHGLHEPWFPENLVFSYPEFKDFPTQIHNSLQIEELIEAPYNSLDTLIDKKYDVRLMIHRFMEIERSETEYMLLIDAIFLLFPSQIEKAIIYFENIFQNPTYRIYLRLFDNSYMIEEEHQKLLFTKVLTNMRIWTQANQSDQLMILHHISSTLFNAMGGFFLAPEYFREMVAQVQEFIPSYETDCLELIDKLLVRIAKESKNNDNIIAVLQSCVSCKDPKLVVRFLNLATELFSFSPKNANYVKYLHSVDFSQHKQLLSPLLRALHACSGDNFYTRTQVLSYQLPLSFTCELLMDDVAQFPVLYSIAITIALKADREQRRPVVTTIYQFSKKADKRALIRSLEFWMLWPAIFVLQTDDREQMDMLSFIANVLMHDYNIDDLDMIMAVFDLLGLRTNISPLEAKSVLLKLVMDSLLIKNDIESFAGIINRCIPVLFFSWEYASNSNTLLQEFSESPFSELISSMIIRKPNYVRTYQDLKTFKFDSSRTFLRFSVSKRENINYFIANAMDSIDNVLESVTQKQCPNIPFLNTVINYTKAKDENKMDIEKTFLDKIDKIGTEVKSQFGPTLQITAMRLNAFVQSLDNQLHGISKKNIYDANDLGKLQNEVKQSLSVFNYEVETTKHNVGSNDPEFRLENFVSSTLIANRLKRNWPKDPRAQISRTKYNLPVKAHAARIKGYDKESVDLYIDGSKLIINGNKTVEIEAKTITDAFLLSNQLHLLTSTGRNYLFEIPKDQSLQVLEELQVSPSSLDNTFASNRCGIVEIITRANLHNGASFETPEKYPLFPWAISNGEKVEFEFNNNLKSLPFDFDATDPQKTIEEEGNISQQFLCVPELYQNVKLPEGFSTVFEYSSFLLSNLKSRKGANYVAMWLERLMTRQFAIAIPFVPKRMFRNMQRHEIKFTPGGARRAFFALSNPITSLAVIVRKDGAIGITAITNDKSEPIKHTIPKMADCIPIQSKGTLYLFNPQNNTLYNMNDQSIVSKNFPKITNSCIGQSTIVATDDGMIHFLNDSMESVFEEPFPYGDVTLISTNVLYNCFAVACKNGSIRFCSLRNHKLISVFDIRMRPEHIESLNEFGFAVHSGSFLFLFTVNGVYVRSYEFERRIEHIAVSNGSVACGALVFLVDEAGQLHAVSPYSKEPHLNIGAAESFPVGMTADSIGGTVLIATETGVARIMLS